MSDVRRACAVAASTLAWLLLAASVLVMVIFDRKTAATGRVALATLDFGAAVYLGAVAAAVIVGTGLVLQLPRHPVGWLFLLLGTTIIMSGAIDAYAVYGILARPGSAPGAGQLAVVSASGWLLWFVLIALVLQLTPTGRPLSRRWGMAATVTAVAGGSAMVLTWFSPRALDDPPLVGQPNPWAVERFGGAVEMAASCAGVVCAVGLVVAAASLVVRFRRARGEERRQLLWLALVVVPMPVLVVGAFMAAAAQSEIGVAAFSGGFILVVPVATGLSIARYRLYDVDRVLSRAATYTVLTLLLAAIYGGTVLFTVWSLRDLSGRSHLATAMATLATVTAAAPLRRWLQAAVDRRFARRRFTALAIVRAALRGSAAARNLDAVLREALGDPGLRVAYLVRPDDLWVTAAGTSVDPAADEVTVFRFGEPVASIAFDAHRVDRVLVESVAAEAAPELENIALRAAVERQLVEVRESRARIVATQLAERHRIERNLHDGAQQRLLALAFQLRAAQLRAPNPELEADLDRAVEELATAVAELRALANGLHPAVLIDGGLAAALGDLAARAPLPVRLGVTAARFTPAVEETAWFVACEAVANAVKHSAATSVSIGAESRDGVLQMWVCDDGVGGADPAGPGLRGIADRADAAGGRLLVLDGRPGTEVRLELPCG